MFVFRFLLCCCVMSIATTNAMAESLQLFYNDGRVISADIATKSLEWTNVSDAGVSTVKTIPLSDIRELVLTKSPAAKQIAEIRQLIEQLDSPKYRLRQEAEKKLADPKLSGPYIDLIQQQADDPRLEVRYRLGRILDRLEDDRVQSNLMFDTLVLKNGDVMQGDAGGFQWAGVFLGRLVKIRRGELSSVKTGSAALIANDELKPPAKKFRSSCFTSTMNLRRTRVFAWSIFPRTPAEIYWSSSTTSRKLLCLGD